MPAKRICIIGAGLAGLSAGLALRARGKKCVIFEQESVPGGLCRSRRVNGFIFDRSGHLLHFQHKDSLAFVSTLLRGALVKHCRNAWVYADGGPVRYPFQANLYGLPRRIAQECLLEFIKARCSDKRPSPEKAGLDRWITETFGRGIARHFLLPYNRKFWTVPVRSLTTDWLDGFIPVPSLKEVIEGSLGVSTRQFGYNSVFWYPSRGGIQSLTDALAERADSLRVSCKVTAVDLRRKRLRLENGEWERYDALVSTLPMPEWERISALPSRVRSSLERLNWTAVDTINLGVRSAAPEQRHWIYFPQESLAFFRVGFSHGFSPVSAPEGTHALYVEISRPGRKTAAPTDAARVLRALRQTGCVGRAEEVLVSETERIPYGYVIYDRFRSAAVRMVKEYLGSRGVFCCGRYGAWEYLSMEATMLQAQNTAVNVAREA